MTWIDLGDPLPRPGPERYESLEWEIGDVCPLPASSEA